LFDTVQELLKQDTRASSKNAAVRPLSGIIFCADCGAAMVHKTNAKNGKRYGYYVCSGHRADKAVCSTHIINTDSCETAVLMALKKHTATLLDIEKIAHHAEGFVYSQGNVRRLTERLKAKQEELRRDNEYRLSLHESYRDNVITREDFISFKASYDKKIHDAETVILAINDELKKTIECELYNHDWISIFKAYINADSLTRKMIVELVEKVVVYEKGRIEVNFRYTNQFEHMAFVSESISPPPADFLGVV
jgi:hypothetical protein